MFIGRARFFFAIAQRLFQFLSGPVLNGYNVQFEFGSQSCRF
jgi:hypothetical protein